MKLKDYGDVWANKRRPCRTADHDQGVPNTHGINGVGFASQRHRTSNGRLEMVAARRSTRNLVGAGAIIVIISIGAYYE